MSISRDKLAGFRILLAPKTFSFWSEIYVPVKEREKFVVWINLSQIWNPLMRNDFPLSARWTKIFKKKKKKICLKDNLWDL